MRKTHFFSPNKKTTVIAQQLAFKTLNHANFLEAQRQSTQAVPIIIDLIQAVR